VLLLLHANSLHGNVFKPMVEEVLSKHFHCIALDLPGHGASPAWAGPEPFSATAMTEAVYAAVLRLGIRGCFVLGQSLGAALGLLVEGSHPGTFSALYVYEPPAFTTASKARILAWEREQGLPSPGVQLEAMALKRRGRFESREAAAASLASKLPFSAWAPAVFGQYIAHGTRAAPGGGWELCCAPLQEAAVYRAMEPPAAFDSARMTCPVVWAVGGAAKGVHSRLPRLGREQVGELASGALQEFPRLSHFGLQEAPGEVAAAATAFFQRVLAGGWAAAGEALASSREPGQVARARL